MMNKAIRNLKFLGVLLCFPALAQAQQPQFSYADVADLAADAPVVIDVIVRKDIVLSNAANPAVPANMRRHYIEAQVQQLIRGNSAVPPLIRFLVDLPADARGRSAKLKKKAFLVMARTVAGRENEIQLVRPDAMLSRDATTEQLVRKIVLEAVDKNAPPAITGIASAFHVAGNIQGESESQFFLNTKSGQPISITVLRRPGLEREWGASLGEIVDAAALRPARDSLLWYRLACGVMPERLPPTVMAEAAQGDRAAAASDYAFVRASLGSCARTR